MIVLRRIDRQSERKERRAKPQNEPKGKHFVPVRMQKEKDGKLHFGKLKKEKTLWETRAFALCGR